MTEVNRDAFSKRYPRAADFHGLDVTVREMTPRDGALIRSFAEELPEHDRLFLQRNITQPEVVRALLEELERETVAGVIAVTGDRMIGYGMVIPSEEAWSEHVAELRVAVAAEARKKGLGRFLAQEAFAIALACGAEKIVARMTPDQKGAIAAFEGLGFRAEGLLRDHIVDREGNRHDLLMMGHDVARFQSALQSYGVQDALG